MSNEAAPAHHANVIVAGLDSSERASGVRDTAIDLAVARHAKLVLVRAIGVPTEMIPEQRALLMTNLPDLLHKGAEADLERYAQAVPDVLTLELSVRVGVAWEAICEEAKARDASLIVVGAHEYGVVDRILGTTAAKVVNHAPCSTLVVR
ncbi:MAG TPA: universal stress protein [Byssovorax sp.]|jgi:nucleotide-binding universal stress UspA family protein